MKVRIPTSLGIFEAKIRNGKLVQLEFPTTATACTESASSEAQKLSAELNEYLIGHRTRFTTPIDLSAGTEFQRKVWAVLQQIPYGETMTYGKIARAIGEPGASRAVGAACGRNPVPIVVPCHRVVAQNNKLGGFSAGLHWKKRLLMLESRPGLFTRKVRVPRER